MLDTISDEPTAENVFHAIAQYERNASRTELGVPSLSDVCKAYNSASPVIKLALPLIKAAANKIPVYGPKVSSALDTLITIADFACPLPTFSQNLQMLNVIPLRASNEDTKYNSAKISNGYGLMNTVGVSVQKGVEVNIDVDFKLTTVSDNALKEWFDSTKSMYTDEEKHKLEENYAAGGFGGGFLAGCFGCIFGGGTYNHYKNTSDSVETHNDTTKQGFLKSLSQVQKSEVHISGSIKAIGQSFIPVQGYVFVETTTVEFQDGTTLTTINTSNPVVADESGDTAKVTSGGGKLKIIPIKKQLLFNA